MGVIVCRMNISASLEQECDEVCYAGMIEVISQSKYRLSARVVSGSSVFESPTYRAEGSTFIRQYLAKNPRVINMSTSLPSSFCSAFVLAFLPLLPPHHHPLLGLLLEHVSY